MANPYKTAEEKKKKAPGGTRKPEDVQETAGVVTTPAEPETKQEPGKSSESELVLEQEEKTEEKEQATAPVTNILADLIPKDKKPVRETYGFYLDKDVHDELIRLTKQSKAKNKSVFLNALLRRVFFGD